MCIIIVVREIRDFGCTTLSSLCNLYLMILLLSVLWRAANVFSLSDQTSLGLSFLGQMTFLGRVRSRPLIRNVNFFLVGVNWTPFDSIVLPISWLPC